MRVFVVGATGFIGARLAAALAAEGCEVVRGQRVATRGLDGVVVDFARDRRLEDWLPRLRGVDVVVNAVGILRERRTASFAAVHEQGPAALFEACIRAGVPKVVQISALGAEPDAPTGYFRSKAAGDTLLSKLPLEWVIVQPSLVFGASDRQSIDDRISRLQEQLSDAVRATLVPAPVWPRCVVVRMSWGIWLAFAEAYSGFRRGWPRADRRQATWTKEPAEPKRAWP
jgi:uncharacterized protein YbjT (DUF2867 family)